MMGVLVVVAWVSAIVRLWATVRFPSRSRWYLTGAVALFAWDLTLQTNAASVDRLLHVPNISILIGHLALFSVGVSVLLYFDSYPDRQANVARRVKPAAAVAAIYTACWAVSPIHTQYLTTFAVTQSSSYGLGMIVSDLYLVFWAAVLAKRSWQHAIRGDTDYSRLGLLIIGLGAMERSLASTTNIIRASVRAMPVGTKELLSSWDLHLAYLASISVAVGAALSVISNGVHLVNTHRRLGPLWRELTKLAPQVVLPTPQIRLPGSAVAFRTTRRRIEIIDSLFVLSLDGTRAEAIRSSGRPETELGGALAAGLVSGHEDGCDRVLAGKVLPPAGTRREETAQLLRMADGYQNARRQGVVEPSNTCSQRVSVEQ